MKRQDEARDLTTAPAVRSKTAYRLALLSVFVKAVLLFLFIVLIFRVIVPYLFDLHQDFALIAAVILGIASIVAVIWFGLTIIGSVRRLFSKL